MGQASSLSVRDDRQDAGPTSNLSFGITEDCFASLAMTDAKRTALPSATECSRSSLVWS